MPGPFNFDAYLGWVNITDPNNIPNDARVIGADDMLRFENLGLDTKEKFAEVDQALANLDSDTAVAASLAEPTSATRAAIVGLVDDGVAEFQEVIDAVPGSVAAQVPSLVTTALAADSTVANAAAGAVSAKLNEAGVMTGAKDIPADDTIHLSWTDSAGRRSWLEISNTGGLTEHTATMIAAAINNKISIPGVPQDLAEESGYVFAIPDANKRIGLGLKKDGTLVAKLPSDATPVVTDTAVIDIATDPSGYTQLRRTTRATGLATFMTTSASNKTEPRLAGTDIIHKDDNGSRDKAPTARYIPVAGGTAWPVLAENRWACFGDSLTAGGWPANLASMISGPCDNWGIGGQTSLQIAARANAIPAALTLAGNSIPATATAVAVTAGGSLLVRPGDVSPMTTEFHNSFTIFLAGVEGILAVDASSNYTFTRKVAGTAVAVPPGTLAYTAHGILAQPHSLIIWAGRNNMNIPADVVAHTQAIIGYNKALAKRVQLMSILPSTDDGVAGSAGYQKVLDLTAALNAAFPGQVLDIASYLRSDQAFVDAGKTKTAQDITDIANGHTPAQFRSDTLHLNGTGNWLVAFKLSQELASKGWA
jgi:lysophospholipase L1-like esterase